MCVNTFVFNSPFLHATIIHRLGGRTIFIFIWTSVICSTWKVVSKKAQGSNPVGSVNFTILTLYVSFLCLHHLMIHLIFFKLPCQVCIFYKHIFEFVIHALTWDWMEFPFFIVIWGSFMVVFLRTHNISPVSLCFFLMLSNMINNVCSFYSSC